MKNFVKTILSTTVASIIGTMVGMMIMGSIAIRSFGRVPEKWKRLLLDMPLDDEQNA